MSFQWTITLKGVMVAELDGKTVKFNFTQPGLYEVTLRVTDGQGLWSEDTAQCVVVDITKPHANAGTDRVVDEDEEESFLGNMSTDNVGIVSFEWSIDPPTGPKVLRTGETFSYAFAAPGIYAITLMVSDLEDNQDSDTITVTVLDVTAPIAVAPSDVSIKVGQTVGFDGRASSDNVGIVKYEWEYVIADVPFMQDDENITQLFDSSGNFTITLTVWDQAGNSDSATFWVDVTKPKKEEEPGFGAVAVVLAAVVATLVAMRRRRRE